MCVCVCVQGVGFGAEFAAKFLVPSDLQHSRTVFWWRWTFVVTLLLAIPAVFLALLPRGAHLLPVCPGVTIRDIVLLLICTVAQVLYVYLGLSVCSVMVLCVCVCIVGVWILPVLYSWLQVCVARSSQHGLPHCSGHLNCIHLLCELC